MMFYHLEQKEDQLLLAFRTTKNKQMPKDFIKLCSEIDTAPIVLANSVLDFELNQY